MQVYYVPYYPQVAHTIERRCVGPMYTIFTHHVSNSVRVSTEYSDNTPHIYVHNLYFEII